MLLLAPENDFHHSDNILQQIISFVCFPKGRMGFFKKINGLLPRNEESLRITLIVNMVNHNFNYMGFENNI